MMRLMTEDSQRKKQRESLGLSQIEASQRANVSLATWRRWEANPDSVGAKTRKACAAVLASKDSRPKALREKDELIAKSWMDNPNITPRQAAALASTLDFWADADIAEWLNDPSSTPLYEVSPFDRLDLRVMIRIGENRAWAAAAKERCYAVADEIRHGILPFDRKGCFFDELLMAMALDDAEDSMKDTPELFTGIPARRSEDLSDEDKDEVVADEDWEGVGDYFDNECRWDEWEVPTMTGHPLLPAILDDHPPVKWFDNNEESGAGYLQRLVGLVVDSTKAPPSSTTTN